jgi:hypothetical protein
MRRPVLAVALTVLLGAGVSSCAGADQEGSPQHRLSVWVSGTGLGGDIGTLVADNQRVPKDVANGTNAVHSACGALEDDAEMANSSLPAPDSDVTDWLTDAYGLEGTAGTECYNAGATNRSLLAQSEKDMAKAEALYARVLARVRAVDGQVVSTTTTTDDDPGGIFG